MSDKGMLQETVKLFKSCVTEGNSQARNLENFSRLREDLIEGYRAGHLSTYDHSWDYAKMYEMIVPDGVRKDIKTAPWGSTVMENAIGAMTSTMFPELWATTTTIGMYEVANKSPYNFAGYCGSRTEAPGKTLDVRLVDDADIVDDSEAELEETQFYGLGRTVNFGRIRRGKKKFAHAMTREMLDHPGAGLVRQAMNEGSMRLLKHRNRQLAKAVFGLFPYGVNPFPHIMNGTSYRSHYVGRSGSGAPWSNAMIGNKLDGTMRPFYNIETFLDSMPDHITGDPVSTMLNDIFVMDALAADKARLGLGLVKIAWDAPANSAATINGAVVADPIAARFGTVTTGTPRIEADAQTQVQFGRVLTDRHVRALVKQWYMDVVKLSAADATEATHQTYAAGSLNACPWVNEWPEEKLERAGNDTWDYFNREVIYMVKYMEKADPNWDRPRDLVINWPDLSQFTLTNFFAAYNSTNGTIAKITGVSSGTASTANLFWF